MAYNINSDISKEFDPFSQNRVCIGLWDILEHKQHVLQQPRGHHSGIVAGASGKVLVRLPSTATPRSEGGPSTTIVRRVPSI